MHVQRARELEPQKLRRLISLPLVLEETGKPEEESIQVLGPSGALAMAFVRSGRRSEAEKLIARDPFDLAIAYTSLGETKRARDSISAAIDRRESNAVTFK